MRRWRVERRDDGRRGRIGCGRLEGRFRVSFVGFDVGQRGGVLGPCKETREPEFVCCTKRQNTKRFQCWERQFSFIHGAAEISNNRRVSKRCTFIPMSHHSVTSIAPHSTPQAMLYCYREVITPCHSCSAALNPLLC